MSFCRKGLRKDGKYPIYQVKITRFLKEQTKNGGGKYIEN